MIDLHGRRIAIVGGAGFIGHHLALAAARAGARVTVIDSLAVNNIRNFSTAAPSPETERAIRFLEDRMRLLRTAGVALRVQDAREFDKLLEHVRESRADTLVHLAAVAHADRADTDPRSAFESTLGTLQASLEVARHEQLGTFVYFSSSMVYGNFRADPIPEDTRCEPLGIYGTLKLMGEWLVATYGRLYGFASTVIRPSALYGPRCVSRRVVQIFVERALAHQEIVLHEPSQRFDFTYIDDLIDGTLRVIADPPAGNGVFNLTFGQGRSLADLVTVLRGHIPDLRIVPGHAERAMPRRGGLSVDKARRLLGYQPAFPLELGIPAYIGWYRAFMSQIDRSQQLPPTSASEQRGNISR